MKSLDNAAHIQAIKVRTLNLLLLLEQIPHTFFGFTYAGRHVKYTRTGPRFRLSGILYLRRSETILSKSVLCRSNSNSHKTITYYL